MKYNYTQNMVVTERDVFYFGYEYAKKRAIELLQIGIFQAVRKNLIFGHTYTFNWEIEEQEIKGMGTDIIVKAEIINVPVYLQKIVLPHDGTPFYHKQKMWDRVKSAIKYIFTSKPEVKIEEVEFIKTEKFHDEVIKEIRNEFLE